ncbi:M4 family metallopeptidase [Pseudomonas sp. LS1212]|uniref:M4 family metallopeptidase n=1 Tax=Pseudomonas sp. LS1212 TaxID=2972478 RepID=UPI00215CDAB7|nr:M4 family metallopeptidase [Pseudomonas sp. LS1212]UVJ42970.1 M4 family metallopeptidase [Pseudomonas sp. LS1212]
MCSRNPLHCIVPPYIIERLALSDDPQVRSQAIANLKAGSSFRATRESAQAMPGLMAVMSPKRTLHRLVYTANTSGQLPGDLARAEGQSESGDPAVDEAYDGAGITYAFYDKLFQRNSLDDNGMTLISTVHVKRFDYRTRTYVPMDNAFWNGTQMAYGDGAGIWSQRFTRSLEVIGHELTHGVQSFTSNLNYYGQSGALNEHFADVFGILVRQWHNNEPASTASWLIGADVLVPAPTRRGIRDMEFPGTAFADDPYLGDDPQPDHMSKYVSGSGDNGGVHYNSGIPNRAFVLVAKALGANAWDVAGRIWYETMLQLNANSQFQHCAEISVQVAGARYGAPAKKAVKAAWKKVGINV